MSSSPSDSGMLDSPSSTTTGGGGAPSPLATLVAPSSGTASASAEPDTPTSSNTTAAPSVTPAKSAEKLAKQAATCEKVLAEIVSTEKMYLANLRAVVDSYVKPLQNPVLQMDLALKPAHLKDIFSNLEQLVGFHSIFYDELNHTVTTAPKTEAVAKTAGIFNKYGDFLKMYTSYVNNYEKSLACLTSLTDNKKFQRFLRDTKSKGAAGGMDLMALLIMPIQRIPRYELLLKEVQRHTEPSPSLSAALEKIQAIGQHVNETKRLVDRIAELLVIQGHLSNSLPHDQEKVFGAGILYAPHRRLIREGELKVRGKSLLGSGDKSRKYYLLNDLLLWTNASHKYKSHMMLLYAQVNEAASPVEEHPLAFEITKFQLSTEGGGGGAAGEARMQQMEKYLLYASSNAERNAWVKDIGLAIQEATALQAAAAPLSAAGVSSSAGGGANGSLGVPHSGDRVRRASEGVMQGVFAELHSVAGSKQPLSAGSAHKQRGGSSTIDEEGLHTPSMPPPPPAELTASVFSSSDGAGASPPRGNHRSSQSHMTPLPNGGGLLALPTPASATSGTPSAPASGRSSPAPPAVAAAAADPSPPPTPTPATPPPIAKRPSLSRPGSIKHTKSPSTPSAPTSASAAATGGSHSRHGSMGAHTASVAAAPAAGTSSGSHSRQQSSSSLHTRQASMGRHTAKQPSAHALAIAADAGSSDRTPSRSHSKNPSASTPVAPAEESTEATVAASSSRPSTPPPAAAAAIAITPSASPAPHSNGDAPSSHSRSASLASHTHSRSSSRSHLSSVVSPVISAVVNGAHYDHSAGAQSSNPTLPVMPPPLSAEEAAEVEGASVAAAAPSAAPAAAATAPPVPPRPLHIRHSSGSSSESTITVHSVHGGAEESKDASASEAPSPLESEWATASACVVALTRNDVVSLKQLKTPTPNVKAALECLAVLLLAAPAPAPVAQTPRGAAAAALAQKKSAALPEKTDDWALLQSLLVKLTFLRDICSFNDRRPATPVPESLEKRLRKLNADPTMSVEAVSKATPAAGVLWRWVLSYCHLFGMGGPGLSAGASAAAKPAGLSSSASVAALKAPRTSMPPAAAASSAGRPASARPSHTRSHSAGGGKRIILPLNEASIAAALADAEAATAASSSKIPVTPRSAAAAKAAPGSAPGGVSARAITITPHRAAGAGAAPGSSARPQSAAPKTAQAPPLPPRRVSQSAHMSKEEVAAILAGTGASSAGPAGRGSFSSPSGSATARSAASPAAGPGSAPSKVASRLVAPASGGGLLKSAKPISMASPGGAGAPVSPAPSSGSRPGSAAGTPVIKRAPSAAALALTTPPSSSATAAPSSASSAHSASSHSASALSKVSPTVPRAADAAKHTPGGGRVKIFSEKTDYSKVTSKVPSADVTGVAAPKPGVVRSAAAGGAGAGAGGVSKKLDMGTAAGAGASAGAAKKPVGAAAPGAKKPAASSDSH